MPLIEPGSLAPDFTLPDQHGSPHTLSGYRGKPVVLYFYPKDDTSGCTAQACQFRDDLPRFDTASTVVLGVSPDNVKSHAKFAAKYDLPFTLLADEPHGATPQVCDAFGVWGEKSMYGRKYMGVIRTTYLVDAEGRVARRWDKVNVPGHAEEVLAAVNELTGTPQSTSTAKKTAKKSTTKKPAKKSSSKKMSKKASSQKASAKKTSAKKKSTVKR